MTIEELHREMVDGFRAVDERFVANDERFDAVDKRFDAVDKKFDAIDRRFDAVDKKFDAVDEKFSALRSDLEARIKEEGDTTRRHFDVMVERVEAAVRIVAEGHAHLASVVDDHEVRLQTIEKRT